MRNSRRGFTLIELIVVIIIIGVLAAIAAPMMTGNLAKAKRSEAIAALGALRTCARVYYSEKSSTWPTAIGDIVGTTAYMTTTDLDGKYYNNAGYSLATNFITAVPITADSALNVNINMRDGTINNP